MDFAPGCALRGAETCCAGGAREVGNAWLPHDGVTRRKTRGGSSDSIEFRRVYREGRRFSGTAVVLYVRPTEGRRRVGITAGRRFGTAVARNRAKRRLREAVRRLEGRLRDHGDLVLVARAPALTAPFDAIVSEMEQLCAAGQMLLGGSPREAGG
jgi:ribonuclease P protein component